MANHVKIVFTNLGSEAGLICKQLLRPVTTPQYCEAVSPNPINKAFTYNGLHRFHTVDLSPQFRKGNFDAVCHGNHRRHLCGGTGRRPRPTHPENLLGIYGGAVRVQRGISSRVSGRTETKTYGSAADTPTFQTLTGRKPLW